MTGGVITGGATTTAPRRVANARMYSMTPAAQTAWRALLRQVLAMAQIDWDVIDHSPTLPIDDLWAREDLGVVQMCGLPFARAERANPGRLTIIAAPRVAGQRYRLEGHGEAVYWSYLMVRADSPYQSLEQTFGATTGYTVHHSQSGYIALRAALAPFQAQPDRSQPLYRRAIGNLRTHRRALQALERHEADVVAIDSYVFDLLALHEPSFTAMFRAIDITPVTPAPLFVAPTAVGESAINALRTAFARWTDLPEHADVRAALLLDGFTLPDASAYRSLAQTADAVDRLPAPWAEEVSA